MGDRSPCRLIMLDIQIPLPDSRDQVDGDQPDANRLWHVIRHLRQCQAAYGLKARHLAVLSAMVGFLKNQRHTMVFASNAALQDRLNHISERSLQRAVRDLVEAGLITRRDSPNRKRFALRRRHSDEAIAFGFDLAPLLTRADEIAFMADEIEREVRDCKILKMKLRALACRIELCDPADERIAEMRLLVRRQLRSDELEVALRDYAALDTAGLNDPCPTISLDNAREPGFISDDLTASDSQIDGHIQKSEKDSLDKKARKRGRAGDQSETCYENVPMGAKALLSKIQDTCPDAQAMSMTPNPTWNDLVIQAPQMAAWLGIDASLVQSLLRKHGADDAAITIFCILQNLERIRRPGAYLRSLLTGRHADKFDPRRWLSQLSTPVSVITAAQVI